MKRSGLLFVVVMALLAGSVGAQQAQPQWLIKTTIYAGIQPLQTMTEPVFRVASGRSASLNLSEGARLDAFNLSVTPTDLGSGRASLRVVVQTHRDGAASTSTFDVLSGGDTAAPTVALRDSSGKLLVDKTGQPLFVQFETTIRR